MNKSTKNIITYSIMILLVLLITACFIGSMVMIQNYAEDDCYANIEEATEQLTNMFNHTMQQAKTQLTMFSDVLVSNSSYTDEQLLSYMRNFCKTQVFSAVAIHRKDGSNLHYNYNAEHCSNLAFDTEVKKVPYISNVLSNGDSRSQKYIYQAVPIVRSGETVAILYGYISLEKFPDFVSTSEYDGQCKYYIVDGKGNFIMDEYHRYDKDLNEIKLGNLTSISPRNLKSGYTVEKLQNDIATGQSGYFVFKSEDSEEWCYAYYMPIGINGWMMQLTVDEPVAFETYHSIRNTVMLLMVIAVFLMVMIILLIMVQTLARHRVDEINLHKADYQNAVQAALINAHNNPYFVDRALEIIGAEIKAETVLLLTFDHRTVKQAQYWPSQDKMQAMALVGIDIRDAFPAIFDALATKNSVTVEMKDISTSISPSAAELLRGFDVKSMMLVPIIDNSGLLKGTIAAVNVPAALRKPEMLECVTRDFFMAITNLENHTIIKKMGEIDYLTGLKNRNSFERELPDYEIVDADNLWFIFVDANGLHELNNQRGHKAGDLMLCTVADIMKKIFGQESTYRLGGDEFVSFVKNSTHEDMMSCKHRLIDELSRKGYSAAVGFDGTEKNRNRVFDVDVLLANAEKMMYKNKREYYESNNITTERYRNETQSVFDKQ